MTRGPVRLRDGDGPARLLMRGSGLNVPSAARRRALAFTGAAAGMAASGTAAAAGATSLVKSVVLYVVLGTAGGGVASLAISETISRLDAPSARATPTARGVKRALPPQNSVVVAPAPMEAVASPVPVPMPVPVVPAAPPIVPSDSGSSARTPLGTGSAAVPLASAKRPAAPSLVEEQALIESARAALARGDSTSALSTLDGYDRSHAQRQFGPEALALRVEALSSRGELGRARSLAAEFRQRYPHHPLLSRVQAAVQR